MPARPARRSALLGIGLILLAVAPVLADTVRADADLVTAGSQAQLDLGSVAPGAVIERDVTFTLVCAGLKHADPGQVVTVSVSSVTVPLAGGSISATNGSIGPVPDSWVSDAGGSVSCPSPMTMDASTTSHVTLVAPPTTGLDYQFTILYAKSLSPPGASDSTSVTGSTGVTFVVDVATPDTTPPVLSGMPADLDVWTDDPAGLAVDYPMPTATDDRDPAPTVGCDPAPASFFVLGTTTVTCTATDADQNSSLATFGVTVHLTPDTTPPVLSGLPSNISIETTDAAGLTVDYAMPTATDDRDPAPAVSCDPPPGALFAMGTTTVTCTAMDADGNSSSGTFEVTVTLAIGEPPDTTPPVLAGMPTDIDVLTTDTNGMSAWYASPTATDDVDPGPVVGCAPAPGSVFPVGATTVTCTAMDAGGNSASASFMVTVHLATADWSGPAGADGSVTLKAGRVFRAHAQSLVDGTAIGGTGSFVVSTCGTATAELTVAAEWQSGHWAASIETTGLAVGCHTVSLVVDGLTFGSVSLFIEGSLRTHPPR
jgi:hypothetical protein